MKTINVSRLPANCPGVVYCGWAFAGWRCSPLHNPFREKKDGTREEIIVKYRTYLLAAIAAGDWKILDALDALTGDSILGCWCTPKPCHCDVIAEVWRTRQP